MAWPVTARAQQSQQLRRIGVLLNIAENDPETTKQVAAIRDGLAKFGWLDSKTVHIEYRFTAANADLYGPLAKELVALQPDVILVQSTPATAALRRETRTIPIVFVSVSDPIGSGFIASLARPGGNITGLIQYEPGIAGKWLAMLKEIAPNIVRVGFLANPKTTPYDYFLRGTKAAAAELAVDIISSPLNKVADIESAIASLASAPNGALLIAPDGFTIVHRERIIALAAQYRLPAVYPWRYFVASGGLMSYGIETVDALQQAASYIDRILRGGKPDDLPVETPIKYETVVNLKTAKALGLKVPTSLVAAADEVIE